MAQGLYGLMTVVALTLAVLLATVGAVFVARMERRAPKPIGEEIGNTKTILDKVRKRQPMSAEEVDYAKQVVADRSSLRALCIPGALFMLGTYFVFGSLYHLHGATPSERTFLGLIPMFTSTNLGLRMLSHVRLKGRLRKMA
jgi:hypothetical protein